MAVEILFIMILITASVVDIRTGRIPNYLSLGGFLSALAILTLMDKHNIIPFLTSSLVSFLIMVVISLLSKNRMGMGDAKLSLVIGGMLGVHSWFLSLFIASLTALTFVVPLLITGKLKRSDPIPFAPFLSLGALLVIWLGRENFPIFF